jgi:hypothetical protein
MPKVYSYGNYKISLSELPEEAWQTIVGDGAAVQDDLMTSLPPRLLYETTAWMYRAGEIRGGAVASCDYVISRGSTGRAIYDSGETKELPPNLVWMDRFRELMQKVELATCFEGRGYWGNDLINGLRWFKPSSIKPKFDKRGKLRGFVRTNGKETEFFKPDEIIYFWPPDYDVEAGPALSYPAKAVLMEAAVYYNQNVTLQAYYKRGGVPVTFMQYERPLTTQEQDDMRSWWNRITRGIKNAYTLRFLRHDLKMQTIGDKPDEYYSPKMIDNIRKSIVTAFGVPETKFLQAAANLGTRTEDEVSYIQDTIRPKLDWYEEVLNKQLFKPLGYRIQFMTERMPAMQEDEENRSDSLQKLVSSGVPLDIAMRILGFHLEQEDMKRITATALAPAVEQVAAVAPMPAVADVEDDSEYDQQAANETRALHTWAKRRVKAGKSLDGFTPEHLTAEQVGDILSTYKGGDATLDAAFFTKATGAVAAIMSMEKTMTRAMLPTLTAIPRLVVDALENNRSWEPIVNEQMQRFGELWTEQATKAARRGIADGKRFTDGLNKKAVKEYEDIDWTLPNENAALWAEQNTARYIVGMSEAMAGIIADDIAEWIRTGQAFYTLLEHWEQTYNWSRDRMDAIATTEITRAYAYGNQAAWQHSGVVWGKQWVTANDELVCPICAPLGGLTFGEESNPATIDQQNQNAAVTSLGSSFIHPGGNGAAADYAGNEYELPPAHTRCRCTIAPIVTQPE